MVSEYNNPVSGQNDVLAVDLTVGAAHRFSQAILDSFAVNIAVLNKDGIVTAVNRAWTLFAAKNGGPEVDSTKVGINYLDVARGKVGPYAKLGQTAYLGIKAVLDGTLPEFSLEYPCHTPTRQRWFLLHVVALLETPTDAAIVSHLDITSLKQAEIKRMDTAERFQEAETLRVDTAEQFQELANHLHQVFWIKDAVETRTLYISPAFEKIWGRTCQSIYDDPSFFRDTIHPDDRERMSTIMANENQTDGYDEKYRILRPDGSVRWIWAREYAVRDDQDQIKRFVGIAEDVTESKQLEAQFIEAQKMEVVGHLAGGVAHDFNNVLGVIMGYSDMIVDELSPENPLQKYAEEIRHAAQRAAGLTQQLLIFSRKQAVQAVALDLNEAVESMDKMLRRLVDENIEMTVVYGNQTGQIKADSGYIWQVLMNLIVNARDAMPNGGKLVIETSNVTLDEAYTQAHPGTTPGDYVMLSVRDTGAGMSEEVKARLFEAFFTTKPKGKGTGLGMLTCQTIVRQSGGHIDVSSELGKGTTFKIYFPRIGQPLPVAASSVNKTGPLRRGGTETLLVVEDEPSVRHLALSVLRAQGYDVLTASNGQDALRVASEHQGQPIALVVTDVIMPHMGGKMMAEWLKSTYPELKILFTSGYTDDAIAPHGVLDMGVEFLPKPYTPATLTRKVRKLLDATPIKQLASVAI
jgi:PAS domain S-box-containing protein